MIKIGVICNPRSQQNKRDTSALKALTDGKPDLLYARLERVEDLTGILADFARKEVGVIAVSGGDGTVQATLTALTTGKRPFAELPAIAVLDADSTLVAQQAVNGPRQLGRVFDQLAIPNGENAT